MSLKGQNHAENLIFNAIVLGFDAGSCWAVFPTSTEAPDALTQDRATHGKPNLRPDVPKLRHAGPQLGSSWAQVGANWPEFGARWRKLRSNWAQVGSCSAQLQGQV